MKAKLKIVFRNSASVNLNKKVKLNYQDSKSLHYLKNSNVDNL